MGSEGGAGACGACRVADANGFMLGKGGRGPRNVVALMLARAWSEVKDGPSEEGTDDRLLKWGDDAGVDGGVHESIFNGVEAVGEDIVVSRDAHVPHYHRWCLVRLSSR